MEYLSELNTRRESQGALTLRLKMEKCVETIQKQTMGVIFNIQNSQSLTWSLPIEELSQVRGQNRPVAYLPLSIFVLSLEKCHYQSQRIRNYQFYFPYFGFLPLLGKFKRHSLRALRIFQCFSGHIPKEKFREMTLNCEWRMLYRSFVSLTERRERRVTCP